MEELYPQVPALHRLNLVEHRVTLLDELFQFFSEPEQFSYLNFI